MNKMLPLLKIQMMGFFNFNKIKYSGNKKERNTAILLLISALFLTVIMEAYLIGLVLGWSYLGLTTSIPALLVVINVAVCFILTFMKSNVTLFGFRDYDLLISLPITPKQFITSRLLPSYLVNVFFSILSFFIPMIVYWLKSSFSISSLMMALLAVVAISLIPMIAAILIGLVTTYIASYFRYANLVIVFLSILTLLTLMLSSLFFKSTDVNQLTHLGQLVDQSIQQIYPLASWLNVAFVENNWFSFLAFFAASLFCGILFVLILSKFYLTLNGKIFSTYQRKTFQWQPTKKKPPLLALYKREWRLYLSSPVYVMNTLLGSLMLIFFSISLLFLPISKIEALLTIPNLRETIQPYLSLLPLVLSIFLVIGTTTSSSISMEGEKHWQLAVLPVSMSIIYQAKLLLNLTITLPAVFISGTILSFSLKMAGWNIFFLFILPVAYSLFSSLIGLLMDCLYAKFDWTNAQQVVKQSFANMLTLFINFLTIFLGFIIIYLFSTTSPFSSFILIVILFGSSLVLYKKISSKNPFSVE